MSYRNPVYRNPVYKNQGMQALALINDQKDVDVAVAYSETELSEWEIIEFTKEEVNVLLNDKFKGKLFDSKEKQEWMTEYIKDLKVCIKWFQKGLEDIVKEKDNLHTMLDSSERKCVETVAAMKIKEEELNSIISKLENNIFSLKESLENEKSQKLDAIDCHKIEKEARMALEKNQNSLKEKLLRAEQNAQTANEKVKTQEDMYKSLQEYNSKLLNELTSAKDSLDDAVKLKETAAIDSNKQVEKEKAAILENLITLRRYYNLLQQELTSAADSRDNAVKQKETAEKEVIILRGELQQLRVDRERQVSELQKLSSKIMRYEESTGRTAAECRSLGSKSFKLEKTCSSQREQISVLQQQLEAANEKLKMADLSSSEVITEIITKYEDQKRIISALEDDLAEAEVQLLEGEKQRKKLHNTVSNLKGKTKVSAG